MEGLFTLKGQDFEWDPRKGKENLKKHGIAFEHACEVFFDHFLEVIPDNDHDEERFVAIGYPFESYTLLAVVHAQRGDDGLIRIISAQRATASERRIYEHE